MITYMLINVEKRLQFIILVCYSCSMSIKSHFFFITNNSWKEITKVFRAEFFLIDVWSPINDMLMMTNYRMLVEKQKTQLVSNFRTSIVLKCHLVSDVLKVSGKNNGHNIWGSFLVFVSTDSFCILDNLTLVPFTQMLFSSYASHKKQSIIFYWLLMNTSPYFCLLWAA